MIRQPDRFTASLATAPGHGATSPVRKVADRRAGSLRHRRPQPPRSRGGRRALVTLTIVLAALVGCGSALAAAPRPPAAASYLFSIPTASGSLTGHDDRHLTLRLTHARDYLTRFTARPLRQAYVVANVDFARRFKSYFATSDPNAVLTYTPPGTQIPVSIVLTIRHPRWDAARHTWTFSATRIRKQPDNLPGTTIHITPPHIANPASFTQATLLIDDSGTCDTPIHPGDNCQYANLTGANLAGVDLSGVILASATMTNANLTGANLTYANLDDASLTHANLTGANLFDAGFPGANLAHANLTGANLTDASLDYAHLTYANLTDANLSNATLWYANLTAADLTGANLTAADLTGADLTGANLTGVVFCNTKMPLATSVSGC